MEEMTVWQILKNFLSRMLSRKWLAPIIFAGILIANDVYNLQIGELTLSLLAGLFGLFEIVEGINDHKAIPVKL